MVQNPQNLADQIDAAFASIEEKRKRFQAEETRKYQDWQQKLARIGHVFDQLRDVWTPPLETLIQKFGDKVKAKPVLAASTREITLDFDSDLARIRLRFRATADSDIRNLILQYDLEVIPILMHFEGHSELEMPIEAVDPAAVRRWIDERILSFVKTYLALHENQYYLQDQMVEDPITGTRFPKISAGATLERGGRTFYFISDETRRQFENRPVSTKS